MTNEEAIESLESIRDVYIICHGKKEVYDVPLDSSDVDAIIKAISALEYVAKHVPIPTDECH